MVSEAPVGSGIVLVGMGNPYLTDDGVGIRLARDIARRLGPLPRLETVEECSVGGLNLLDVFAGYESAIVIDSIRTAKAEPGDWYRFTASALRETLNLSSIHDANFATALELGRRTGVALPRDDRIHVFAVEVRENMTFSEDLSDELAREYPAVLEAIASEVRELVTVPMEEGQHESV